MDIIERLYNKKLVISKKSKHCKTREYRNIELTEVYAVFLVNNSHINGLEYHYILKNSKIIITNVNTNKLITVLNARPMQLMRYFVPKDDVFNSMLDISKGYLKNKLNK